METNEGKCIVHFLPARSGDCLVVELDNKNCILIDCGYPETYRYELKPLLKKLATKGCKISLMIITHIDDDHISGAVSFIEDNGDAKNPNIIQVDEIWHNGVFNLIMNSDLLLKHKTDEVTEDILSKCSHIRCLLKEQFPGEIGTISAKRSKTFESACAKYHYSINAVFDNRCVMQGKKIYFDGCEIKVLSPGTTEIEKFQKKLDIELKRIFGVDYLWSKTEEFEELFELLSLYMGTDDPGVISRKQISARTGDICEWLDTSSLAKMNEINCASIVVTIQYKEHKLLFMGDSESELWTEQLNPYYDLIKVSHHGTTKPNLAWMKCIKADKLLISTDGRKYRHPEDDFLARAMMGEFEELYFNYKIQRKKDILSLQERYHFRAAFEKRDIRLL